MTGHCPDCGEYVPGYYDGPLGHLWTNHYREKHAQPTCPCGNTVSSWDSLCMSAACPFSNPAERGP